MGMLVLFFLLTTLAFGQVNIVNLKLPDVIDDEVHDEAMCLTLLQRRSETASVPDTSGAPGTNASTLGFCDVTANSSTWEFCRTISRAEDCVASCVWSSGDPFPGFCGIRDDPSWERACKKFILPSECVPSSCQWFRYPRGPGPVQWLP
ncbi:unnamed protein product [Durusdinium trenchii]|uniref:Uncharacterized protein n=2 Tax=Durusdinium trenchii TaxID=1381693 RepID=A0ABP0NVT4_9DINO